MSVTLSSLPGKFKCSLLNFFCPDGITPNSGLTGPNNTYIYIYIYIYIDSHPQTDCFVVSQLFSVARHVERLKPGLKPAQLNVRLSIRPRWLRN